MRRAKSIAAKPSRVASQPEWGRPESQATCIHEDTTNMAITSKERNLGQQVIYGKKEIAAPQGGDTKLLC